MALHNAAKNIGGGPRRSPVIPIVLVVALIAIVVVLTQMANRTSDEMAATKALEQAETRSIGPGRGQRGTTTLGDGTKAQMGSDTHLRIPPGFNAQVRVIAVDGSVQFTVAEGQTLPFRVRSRDVGMIPHGKVISVRAYEEEPEVVVMANDGPVDIHPKVREAETVVLPQGSAMGIDKDGKTRILSPEEATAAFAWVDGNVVLSKMPLKNVLNVVSRWYGTHVKLADPSLDSREVTATLKLDSSKEALELIAASANGHLGFIGDTLVIADGVKDAPGAKKKK